MFPHLYDTTWIFTLLTNQTPPRNCEIKFLRASATSQRRCGHIVSAKNHLRLSFFGSRRCADSARFQQLHCQWACQPSRQRIPYVILASILTAICRCGFTSPRPMQNAAQCWQQRSIGRPLPRPVQLSRVVLTVPSWAEPQPSDPVHHATF